MNPLPVLIGSSERATPNNSFTFQDSSDGWTKNCSELLDRVRGNCDELIQAIRDTSDLTREIRQLEDQIGQRRSARALADL